MWYKTVWDYLKIYLIHTILITVLAYSAMDLTPVFLAKFACATLISLLFMEKIILKTLRVVPTTPSVREQLKKECPVDPSAGDKIAQGSLVKYDDYLFSACEQVGTCDGPYPDEISAGIIGKTEPCGSMDLKSTGLKYSNDKGWDKATDCEIYTDDSAYLPDACLENIWKASGCTNILAADKQYNKWKKQTKKAVVRDIKSWATLQDTTHRTLCYGKDQSKWPQPPPPPPINCDTIPLTSTNLPDECLAKNWAAVGCTNPELLQAVQSTTAWKQKTKNDVNVDMNLWAIMPDDDHRTKCYGEDRSKWPVITYAAGPAISQWNNSGFPPIVCPTGPDTGNIDSTYCAVPTVNAEKICSSRYDCVGYITPPTPKSSNDWPGGAGFSGTSYSLLLSNPPVADGSFPNTVFNKKTQYNKLPVITYTAGPAISQWNNSGFPPFVCLTGPDTGNIDSTYCAVPTVNAEKICSSRYDCIGYITPPTPTSSNDWPGGAGSPGTSYSLLLSNPPVAANGSFPNTVFNKKTQD